MPFLSEQDDFESLYYIFVTIDWSNEKYEMFLRTLSNVLLSKMYPWFVPEAMHL